jgi:hypothetical protein
MTIIMRLTRQASSKYVSGRFHSPLHGHNSNAVHQHFHPVTQVQMFFSETSQANCY